MDMKKRRQHGAALIVTLVLLAVALLLGVSSFQSSRMDESMAGNYRASSAAFMAAEYGGSVLWEDFLTSDDRGSLCSGSFPSSFSSITSGGESPQLDVKYRFSCSPEFKDADEAVEKFGRYTLVSTGRVDQDVPVDRHILYSARVGIGPGAPLVAADTEECNSTVNLPSSNADFVGDEDVDGNFKAALQVGCVTLAEETADSVLKNQQGYIYDSETDTYTCDPADTSNNNLCNYKGGIQGGIDIEVLRNPELLSQFLRALRDEGDVANSPVKVGSVFPTSSDFLLEDVDGDGVNDSGVYFLEPDPSHTNLDGNGRANFIEGGNFSGKGLLVIDGNVNFQGVPNFEGLIIVLGDYIVDGGGGSKQGDFSGSVVSAPVDWDFQAADSSGATVDYTVSGGNEYQELPACPEGTVCDYNYSFAPKTLEIGGGGDSSYTFDDLALLEAFDLVDHVELDDGTGRNITDLWGLDGVSLGDRYYIAEWQEIFSIEDAGMDGGGI